MKNVEDWFKDWFNSPYYHILYSHRDDEEAAYFINNLVEYLDVPKDSKVLDLACGKGRHALHLAEKGFMVDGADLSERNIKSAEKHFHPKLQFHIHDMRDPINRKYNYIFNFFTSFGYFDNKEDNLKTLQSLRTSLLKDGKLVIDFLNIKKTLLNLLHEDVLVRQGIEFHIKKSFDKGNLIKEIKFQDKGEKYYFAERVQGLFLHDFKALFKEAGFTIEDVFGDYDLHPFDEENSNRLILIVS